MAIIGSLPYILTNGTVADATQVMADLNQIVNNVNANAAGGGVNNTITGLAGLVSPPSGAGSLIFYGTNTAAGTANAITVTGTYPAGFTLTAGTFVWFVAGNVSNTGAATLNVLTTGVVSIQKPSINGLVNLTGGEITPGVAQLVFYDGTVFELLNTNDFTALPYTAIASAATTNLGGAASKKLNVTGTTTITSFGASATAGAYYALRFDNALTLTYNATSLQVPGSANILTAPGDTAVAYYAGAGNWVVTTYTRALQTAVATSISGLVITNDAGSPNTKVDVSANLALLASPAGFGVQISSPSFVINTGTTGANGMDAGGLTASNWFYVFMISNGTIAAGLISASATAPTLPSGYTYFVRIGAVRTDTSGNLNRCIQRGRSAQNVNPTSSTLATGFPQIAAGSAGNVSTPTYVAYALGAFFPSTAVEVVYLAIGFGVTTMVAPNSNYGSATSAGNPPFTSPGISGNYGVQVGRMVPESANIYYASNGTTSQAQLYAVGWVDAVPAN